MVVPYLAYMRQDRAFRSGEAVSQRVIGALLARACDALVTVDPHLHRTHSLAEILPGIEVSTLSAAEALSPALAGIADPLVVGPDAESQPWVEALCAPLGLDSIVGRKHRRGDCAVELALPDAARAAGRTAVLVDDLVSSGATLAAAARRLLDAGAVRVEALATHCLASPADLERLRRAGVAAIRSTDSVPGPTATLSLAELLAAEIRRRGWLA
jgi:ribose-phosphate pyrophosphokinase